MYCHVLKHEVDLRIISIVFQPESLILPYLLVPLYPDTCIATAPHQLCNANHRRSNVNKALHSFYRRDYLTILVDESTCNDWQSTDRRSSHQVHANNHYMARLAIGVLVCMRVIHRSVGARIRDRNTLLNRRHHQWIKCSVTQSHSIVGTLDGSKWVSRMATFPYSMKPNHDAQGVP